MARQNLDASIEIISSDTLPATAELAGLLEIGIGQPAVPHPDPQPGGRAAGGYLAGIFPGRTATGVADLYAEEKSVTRTLARLGVGDYTRRFTRVTARLPDSEIQTLLHVPRPGRCCM